MKIDWTRGFTRYHTASGFTLIELLIVIAIVGILATGVVVAVNPLAKLNSANLAKVEIFDASIQNRLSINLVGEWTFNDGTAKDTSGYGNNGTLNGDAAITANDRKGQTLKAATFDGTGDYMSVSAANSTSLNITGNQVSISVWAKSPTSPGNYKYLASKINNFATVGYAMYTGPEGNLRVYVAVGGVNQLSADTGSGIWDGTWKHLVGVYNNGTLLIYVNGIQKVSTAVTAGNITSSSAQPFNIGSYNDTGQNSFNGQIDDVRIYNQALLSFQIQQLYAQDLTKHQLALE